MVARAELVRSTEVRDWAAVRGLVTDVMRKITSGLIGSVRPTARGADPVGASGHHLVEFLQARLG